MKMTAKRILLHQVTIDVILVFIVDLATGPTVTLGDGTQCTLPATYLYDATSGFYYDSSTGLYFDPKSQVVDL